MGRKPGILWTFFWIRSGYLFACGEEAVLRARSQQGPKGAIRTLIPTVTLHFSSSRYKGEIYNISARKSFGTKLVYCLEICGKHHQNHSGMTSHLGLSGTAGFSDIPEHTTVSFPTTSKHALSNRTGGLVILNLPPLKSLHFPQNPPAPILPPFLYWQHLLQPRKERGGESLCPSESWAQGKTSSGQD